MQPAGFLKLLSVRAGRPCLRPGRTRPGLPLERRSSYRNKGQSVACVLRGGHLFHSWRRGRGGMEGLSPEYLARGLAPIHRWGFVSGGRLIR